MLCRYCLNYEKGISYSPKKYSNGADYDSRHFTVESSRLPCIFFFFLVLFSSVVLVSKVKMSFAAVLIWWWEGAFYS